MLKSCEKEMKKSKYSKVIFVGLLALSSIVPSMQNIQAEQTDSIQASKTISQDESTDKIEKETLPQTNSNDADDVVYPTKITLNATLLNLGVNESSKLDIVAVTGAQNWDKLSGVAWTSSNPDIATVDAVGNVSTLKAGEAEITATVIGSPSVQAVCKIIVSDQKPEEIYPTGFAISSSVSLDQGKTKKLSVGYKGVGITNKEVIWTSSNENVATVSEDGTITAVGAGTAEITVTSVGKNAGQSEPASATCTVSVTGMYDGLKYKIDNNQITITGYTGTKTDVQIPSEINGIAVKTIQANAFIAQDLTSVVIPSSVTSIGKNSFRSNKSLSQVVLPSTISNIAEGAFSNCTSLTSIQIPEGVTTISKDAFNNCKNLSMVTLPKSLKVIGSNAFADCDSLKTIKLPDNLTNITSTSFEKTVRIIATKGSATAALLDDRSISYEASVLDVYPTTIGLNEDEKELVQGDTFQLRLNSYSGNPTNKELSWSTDNPAVATVDENGLVTAMKEGTAVITATSVGKNEGQEKPASATCTIHVEGVEGNYVYTINDGNVTITDYKGSDTDLVIPSVIAGKPVMEIGGYSFWSNDDMTSVVIPEGVTKIGDYAFNGNDNLHTVSLPSTLKTIGARAFWGTDIEEITIPEGVTSIGREAFNSCDKLVKVTLAQSVTSLGPNAFNSCDSLKEIILPDNITYIGTNALKGIETIYVKAGSKTQGVLDKQNISYVVYTDSTIITNTVPVLSVSDVTIYVGDSFDPMKGIKAVDAEDGDITDQIVYSGKVDTSKIGEYEITYSVSDSQGASAKKTIKVTVKEKQDNTGTGQQSSESSEKTNSSSKQDVKKTTDTAASLGIKSFSLMAAVSTVLAGALTVLKKKKF